MTPMLQQSALVGGAITIAVLLIACSEPRSVPVTVTNLDDGHSIALHVADSLFLRLTTGTGYWVGPPTVSSGALRYIDEVDGPRTPGGSYQVFRFIANDTGAATIDVSRIGATPSTFTILATVR